MIKKLLSTLPMMAVTVALLFADIRWCGSSMFFFGEPPHPDLK